MIDREHDGFNWGLILVLIACAFYWVNVYYHGFFGPTMWTIVITAVVVLSFRLSGRI